MSSCTLPKPENWKELKEMLVRNLVDCMEKDYDDFVEKADAMQPLARRLSVKIIS